MRFIKTAQELEAASPGESMLMRATATTPELPNDNGRIVTYVFSDDSVARDGHTIASNGWALAPFRKNPVFLFAHDANQPPIGRVLEVGTVGGKLRGAVEYLDRDVYPFADTIFQMVKRGYLNAVSVSWLPLEWKFSQDKSRMGGIDFLKQELLEVSQVPVPALSSALAEARAAGLDTSPMVEWAERMLDGGGKVLVPRDELENLRRNAKMPVAPKKVTRATMVRGLYTVGSLADLVAYLMSIQASVQWEAEVEQDGSDIPGRILALAKELGQVLVDMTVEEVTELFAGTEADGGDVDFVEALDAAAKSPAQRALLKLGMLARKMKEAEDGPEMVPATEVAERIARAIAPFERKGRVLSAANEKDLASARDLVDGVLSQVVTADDEAARQAAEAKKREAEEKAARERKAKARARKANLHK